MLLNIRVPAAARIGRLRLLRGGLFKVTQRLGLHFFGPNVPDRLSSLCEEPAVIDKPFNRAIVIGLAHTRAGRLARTKFLQSIVSGEMLSS